MLKYFTNILKFIIPLGLGAVLFLYVYRDTNLEVLLDHLNHINYEWVVLSMFISLFGFYLRAFRWKLLLEPLGHDVKTTRVVVALFIGFFANLLFPRLGEITRCGYLKKSDDVSISESFGTVISERIIDLLCFVFVALLTFVFEWEVFARAFIELIGENEIEAFSNKLLIGAGLIVVMSIVVFAVYKFKLLDKIKIFMTGLLRGLLSVMDLKRRVAFLLSTLGIWLIYFLMLYVLFFSMEGTSDLSPMVAMSVLTAGTVGMIVPVQSGIGTYHFFVSIILTYYGINGHENEVLPLVSHGSQTLLVLVFGLLSLAASFFIVRSDKANIDKSTS